MALLECSVSIIPRVVGSDRGDERGWYYSSPPLLAYAWKDKKTNFLFIMQEATGPTRVLKTFVCEGQVTREAVTFMRGVDRGDQLIGYYNISRRSEKWWKRFGYVIEVAALNAYIIQKEGHPPTHRSKLDCLKFRVASLRS